MTRVRHRPAIETPRLSGEPVLKRHATTMVGVLSAREMYAFLPDDPPDLAELERRYEFLSGGISPDGEELWLTWVLLERERAEPIGFVQATVASRVARVGYVLNPSHWGKGYGREAVGALLGLLFERYRIEGVIAEIDTRNEASIGLVRSLGFSHVATMLEADTFKGQTSDEDVYELTASEWRALRLQS